MLQPRDTTSATNAVEPDGARPTSRSNDMGARGAGQGRGSGVLRRLSKGRGVARPTSAKTLGCLEKRQAATTNTLGARVREYQANHPIDLQAFKNAGPQDQLWEVYNEEAEVFDLDMVQGWKDTMDVFLVFAGLFSATVTAFLLQSASSLSDPTKINNYLLAELIAVQRAAANGTSMDSVDPSPYAPGDTTGEPVDVWVNALWILVLMAALMTALLAFLVKQWLQHYLSVVQGTQRDRALVRQYRFTALHTWKVSLIIDVLPIFLHVALFLFLLGLAVFFHRLHTHLSYLIIIGTGIAVVVYFCLNFLPLIYPDCTFKIPFWPAVYAEVRGWLAPLKEKNTRKTEQQQLEVNAANNKRGLVSDAQEWLSEISGYQPTQGAEAAAV
ncbi:uncharacterized protein C8Q71DRAFT_727595 [Rhodofomes roseus]|uniref:DUF6535 domain-containing protein n=1 Tax=Rhodofomes roseus TaxID=34475 RepID=A0ABQ8K106_9APHY|nr:uncharacterized protein C8Q71DRAFT_727595 [Rhodofomes roseus]KAH9830362.1 hypothetical protein C8Q71DRAFT_727595 [Rhodofomes roseus]